MTNLPPITTVVTGDPVALVEIAEPARALTAPTHKSAKAHRDIAGGKGWNKDFIGGRNRGLRLSNLWRQSSLDPIFYRSF